jgi:hypothetical protein
MICDRELEKRQWEIIRRMTVDEKLDLADQIWRVGKELGLNEENAWYIPFVKDDGHGYENSVNKK